MAKLLIKNIELLHTPNGEMQNIAVEDNRIVYVGKDVPADFATDEIVDGKVKVNGEVEERRGRKLHKDDVFTYQGQDYKIV